LLHANNFSDMETISRSIVNKVETHFATSHHLQALHEDPGISLDVLICFVIDIHTHIPFAEESLDV